jgi:hypothetical protein
MRTKVLGPKKTVKNMFAPRMTLIACGLSLAASGCAEQNNVQCAAAVGEFAAKYELKSGTGPCAELPGEILGLQTYVTNPQKGGDRRPSIAIKSGRVGEFVANGENEEWIVDGKAQSVEPVLDTNTSHQFYSFGKFEKRLPNGKDICTVPTLSDAALTLPEIAEHEVRDGDNDDGDDTNGIDTLPVDAQPAQNLKYKWSNVRVYVTPALTGVQFAADLSYTEGSCTAKYSVKAVSPATWCDDGNGKPDDSLCVPGSDPWAPSLSPDIPVKCDPELLLCVIDGDFPALK